MGLADVFQAIQKKLNYTKDIEISGIKFELGLLSFEQEMKSESIPQDDMDPLVYFNETRLQTLSYAVKSINGESVPEVVEIKTGDKTEKIQGSLFVKASISKLPLKITEQLFDAYIDHKDESEASLDKELKYTWFKTPEQREEERKKKTEERAAEKSEEKSDNVPDEKPIAYTEIPKPADEEPVQQ
jgi:hypothetical protein